jgi:SAM-dependent methyltransferase
MSEPTPSAPSDEEKAKRSRSFGKAATHYERYRPGPPAAAVAWLLPAPVDTVVDLGAGTGALARLLTDRAHSVIAVEPDERMRGVLVAEVPGVTVVEGRGESMPLADRSADAVVASSSWHWVDPVGGLREVARVLKPGGTLGVLWAGPDPESPFMVQARTLLGGVDTGHAGGRGAAETVRAMTTAADPASYTLQIPGGLPFSEPEHRDFHWNMALDADQLIGLLGTLSWVILMEADDRDALFQLARRLLRDALGVEGDVTGDLVFRCDTYRAQRLD